MYPTRPICLIALLLAFMAGCTSTLQKAAIHLDKVAKSVDKFGFAGVSTPLLAGPSEDFNFDLNKSADYFYQQAFKPQGGSRHYSAKAIDFQGSLRVNIEQALAAIAQYNRARSIADIQQAKRAAAVAKAGIEQLVEVNKPTLDATNTDAGASNGMAAAFGDLTTHPLVKSTIGMLDVIANQEEPSTDALPGFEPSTEAPPTGPPFETAQRPALSAVGGSFSPGLDMPEAPFQISAREALLIASGDVLTQSLLRWYLTPSGNKQGNYELFFCPVIVSVQPGYETRQDYQADITVNVDLARQRGDELEFLSEKYRHSDPPIQIAGVFPVIDSQVMELANSRRELYSTAFQLALLGFGSQANFFLEYAQKLEQDVWTNTALTAASAYTLGSSSFGFRVEPKIVASEDPTDLRTKAGDILESKTFPAMAVLLVHRSYLRDRDASYKSKGGAVKNFSDQQLHGDSSPVNVLSPPSRADDDNKYDFLVFRTSVRWSPNKKRCLIQRRYTEVDAWRRAEAIDFVEDQLVSVNMYLPTKLNDSDQERTGKKKNQEKKRANARQIDFLSSRALTLRRMALDTQSLVRVYHTRPADKIIVHDVAPTRGWIDQHTVLTIRGSGFSKNVRHVTVGGIQCEYKVLSDNAMVVMVPPWGERKTLPKNVGDFADSVARIGGAGEQTPEVAESPHWFAGFVALETQLNALSDTEPDTLLRLQIEAEMRSLLRRAPLSPHETKLLDGWLKQVVDCTIGPGHPKWQDFKDLLARARADHERKLEKEKIAAKALKTRLAHSALAEVVIGAKCEVKREGGKVFPETRPANKPNPTNPTTTVPFGWIKFDKRVAKSSQKTDSKAEISVTRDSDGRITGVKTGAGSVANASQLLRIVAHALCCGSESDGRFSLSLDAHGGVNLDAVQDLSNVNRRSNKHPGSKD